MPLTKTPPNFDGTSSTRSKVRARPHTASGSYSKPSSSNKLKSVAYSSTTAQKTPTPVNSPLGKSAHNEGPYWLSGLKSPERKRRPRTQGETTWERRAREYEEEEEIRRALWLAERQAETGRPDGESATRDRETYMDGDGYIHNPLMRTDTRETPLVGEGHVLDKVRSLKENGTESGQRGGLLEPEPVRSSSRRRAVESGLWEIGSKEPSELSNSSDSENDDDNDDVISFKNDVEEQEKDREEFSPLTTPLLDSRLDFMNEVSFSNRGSVLLSGKKALEVKRERERTIARANRRSMQEIDSEEGAGTSSDAVAQPSQPQLESVDGTARSTLRSQSIPDESGKHIPFAAPEATGEPEENNNSALAPQPHLSSPSSAEPLRSAPPTPEPTREAPSIPVPDIQPLPQRAQTQRVRNIGEDPSPERPSSSPRPVTPTQRPQSSPEPSRSGISTNLLSAGIHDTMRIEPKVLLEKQLEARPRMPSQRHTLPRTPSIKTLSQEVEAESLKVRSMYEAGSADTSDWKNGALVPPSDQYVPRTSPVSENNEDVFSTSMANRSDSTLRPRPHTAHPSSSVKRDSVLRRENELAGGIEDWEGVPSERVDRYGFIVEPPSPSAGKASSDMGPPPPPPPQRVSTALQLASETPRQGIFGRRPSNAAQSMGNGRTIDPKSSQVSLRTQGSVHRSPARTSRAIINRLPGMSERRVMSEAGDMLTAPPGLGPSQEPSPAVLEARRKTEARRAEKWRKMAKVVRSPTPSKTTDKGGEVAEPGKGGGMHFTFNTSDPKLVSRVWKGIPDRWRATAWHSFLATSAKKHPDMASDEELGEAFRELVDCSSADDVQIDMDVPRTINSHIMFRSRYRGGQRLLFRVLHCLSLYFPETGYVQGMASLAATLLCYFEEEGAFVIAVRMWELRGLKKLYAPGFEGLMTALDEFKEDWLMKGNNDVNKQLDEMGIHPTAYGTRWYLTLFNYSVPFETQLRVWDLFMLLGDETPCPPGHRHTTLASTPHHGIGSRPSSAAGTSSPTNPSGPSRNSHLSTSSTTNNNSSNPSSSPNTETTEQRHGFHGQLDILHAAGCAIVDGTRGIILESDFENVMKNLTSWVPVKDEEMFVRVVRAEWRRHGRK